MSKKTSQRTPTASQRSKAEADESAELGLEIVKRNAGLILGVVVITVALVIVISYTEERRAATQADAWKALVKAEEEWREVKVQDKQTATPPFNAVKEEFANTKAAAFATLRQAQTLYDRGGKEDLEKAKALLEGFVKSNQLSYYKDLAAEKVKAIDSELSFTDWEAVAKAKAEKDAEEAKKKEDAEKAKEEASKPEAPEDEAPKDEAPKDETPKDETPKEETPKDEAPKVEAPKEEASKEEAPKQDAPKEEAPEKADEAPKPEAPKTDEAPKADAPAPAAPKPAAPTPAAPKPAAPKPAAPKPVTPEGQGD